MANIGTQKTVTSMDTSDDISVPSFFPAVTAECKEAAAKFFICIEKSMQPLNAEDTGAAKRGLKFCLPDMKLYQQCMQKSLANGSEKLL
ncbi:hypothetical protein DFA_04249 [Cavenderia fasciculata]|uniref:Uncharacterized protein n=1 Tax=Cavenderia fasciculata TaxID=261658 RepID=F4PP18_CACFS|nr:uncharacterized protein DFA_04249 [Cavenderia fasciculata]EGG22131.1 hypothetical protein DFA_04249 [Cavenderia fasciculata]|eukprot:XP_004359982.1 hypothetical protein DFA_04249 [Cavenderia fasciculata]